MSVKIRLTRFGNRRRPFYRIIAADSTSPRDGRFIDTIGFFDPLKTPKWLQIDMEKMKHWIKAGGIPTETVANLVKKFKKQTTTN